MLALTFTAALVNVLQLQLCSTKEFVETTNTQVSFFYFIIFTGCFLDDLWDVLATDAIFLPDVSLLNASDAQYPRCDNGSVGSVVLKNTTLNTATVVYYTGTTTYSRACFVCDEGSGYEPNTPNTERVCQSNGTWSGGPIICGTYIYINTAKKVVILAKYWGTTVV